MVTALEQLFSEHRTAFHFSLITGSLNGQNIVDWIYMLEDETIIPYIQGGSLIVTTGARQRRNPQWLHELVAELIRVRASGLIVNTGKYIRSIPDDVISLCRDHNFPLITMPWEMRITEMTQTLCMTIINNQQENLLHDRAMHDAILHPEDEDAYRERLAIHYDLKGDFTIVAILARDRNDEDDVFIPPREMEYLLERKLRALRPSRLSEMRITWIQLERLQLLVTNHAGPDTVDSMAQIAQEVYARIEDTHNVYIGVGTTEMGVRGIAESYQNALTALRLSEARGTSSVIYFREMGFRRILLSCRKDSIPRRYADELLSPIDRMGSKSQEYLELLDAYIRHDRSLEGTAEELFLHRNTVNYRLKKLRELTGSPLKTAEDLFPYLMALYIRNPGK